MKLRRLSGMSRASLVAGTAALALAVATAGFGLSFAVAVTSLAAILVAIVPLSQLLCPGFLARQRYQRYHRPLAGPRPGANLG